MDSIENIKKHRKKVIIYSIVLVLVGIALGFLAYYLYDLDTVKTSMII
jgi:Kef-type K+ transport system membrane component KefB